MPTPRQSVPVLLHGFLGFPRLGPIAYFRGVEAALRDCGVTPLIPALPPASSVSDRAEALAKVLKQHPSPTFVLIGHSMGGLDGRFLITHLDPEHRVRSLVTVATPHRGTAVARDILDGRGPLSAVARRYWRSALTDLDPATRLHDIIADRPGVRYCSYAAGRRTDELPFWLVPFARFLQGDNDGLVSRDSATWGHFCGSVHADHFEAVGWSLAWPSRKARRPFDHIPFWRRIVTDAIASDGPTGEDHEQGTITRPTREDRTVENVPPRWDSGLSPYHTNTFRDGMVGLPEHH